MTSTETRHPLTRKKIREFTGHTPDALRMALSRAKPWTSVAVPAQAPWWPVVKTYNPADIWNLFSDRIIDRVSQDESLKDSCWEYFGDQICEDASKKSFGNLFADRMQ